MGRRTTRLWTLIHMIIVFGTLFMLAGLVAIRHTAEGGLPEPTNTTLILTIIGPTVVCLWLFVMGILLFRNTARLSRSALPLALSRNSILKYKG